jgi:hypothetical protein
VVEQTAEKVKLFQLPFLLNNVPAFYYYYVSLCANNAAETLPWGQVRREQKLGESFSDPYSMECSDFTF